MRGGGQPSMLEGMEPEITPLDPADDSTVDAVLALRVAVEAADVPDFPPRCPYAFRGELTHPVSHMRKERFVARRAGEVVGFLVLELPMRDNLDNADLDLSVHPAHRRHGIGRALYAYAVDRLRELGRERYAAFSVETLPGGPVRDDAGGRFAAAMGAKSALDEVRRRLDLTTVDQAELTALRDGAQALAAGYRLVSWRDHTPDEYAADASYLSGRLISDAPIGDLQWEPAQMDVTRLRAREGAIAASRVRVYATGAVHEETGRLIAVTDLALAESTPWHAWQWITLVEPRHRGHRLGALVKVANLRFVQAHEPELRAIDTWNAAVNDHMISINEAMGFRPVDRWVNWQQDV
jgi:GNAT superfamily N-acetyltransferase